MKNIKSDDAELVIVAYGTAARIAKGAIKRLSDQGMKVGLFRPITLWPFPELNCAPYHQKLKILLFLK